MARHSFSYVDSACDLLLSVLLKYAIGWPCCIKTAPIPLSLASVSIVNSFAKFGKLNTGVVVRDFFRESKLRCNSGVHTKVECFLSGSVKGLLIRP